MYNSEDPVEPYWAEYSGEASGRDPLAIQNSSVVIYSKMIVGITNVTNRIRYNGFFCWIFDIIARNIDKSNSLMEQIRYSRRAELLLAYIMVKNFPEITGVSGSAYAKNHLSATIKLKNGADWEYKKEGGPGLYWKFKAGIFGQYYSGVVRELNLINHPQGDLNIYSLTEHGNDLAKAYDQNLKKKEKELFWNCVYNGKADDSDLINLKSFALHIIPDGSNERFFYERLMLSHDDKKVIPTFNRRSTIKLILNHLISQPDGVENLTSTFLKENYLQQIALEKIGFDAATGWYLFEMNELLHVAFEHFHACFLYTIETHPTLLDNSIETLIKETTEAFKDDKFDTKKLTLENLAQYLSKLKLNTYDYYFMMEQEFAHENYGETLKNAIKTILSIFLESKHHYIDLAEFAGWPDNNFNRTGYAIELLNDLVKNKIDLNINEYTREILMIAINLHVYSSYIKTRIGQSMVHNYMIDGPTVWRLRETIPNRTTPRLQNVIQYITDIGWVDRIGKKYTITESGTQILSNL